MTPLELTAPTAPDRKPRDDEIDLHGLTHPGKVRTENQDHFLVCALRRQTVVQLTSLPDPDRLMGESERVGLLMMVADGVGGGSKGAEASRIALEGVAHYLSGSIYRAKHDIDISSHPLMRLYCILCVGVATSRV